MPRKKPELEPGHIVVEAGDAARDFVMARLAAGRSAAQSAIGAIDDALAFFVNPDDDKTGKERRDLVETALEDAGVLCRALESAEEQIGEVDYKMCEPWEDDDDD